ncbi:MAG TPA: glycosyltransferase family A protein [Verrucomicrobiae bacterium]|jgi:glycosyltransferase involved in cell wall biosynthesis
MKISVILCTHNPREEFLRRTLASLQNQTLVRDEWELLLIDNASTIPLSTRCDLSWHPRARHLLESKLGKLNAWLLGMAEARAEILLFVDDDNVLALDYLEQALVVGAQWPFVGAWGGSLVPEYEKPLPDWVRHDVWRLTVVEVKEDIWSNLREGYTTIPVGAGLCVRRPVAQKYLERCRLNPLSAKLDRAGKGLGGYGDIDLAHCAIDLGLGTGKSTRLSLTHLIPAGRLTLDYFVRHAEGDAISMLLFRASRGLPISQPKPLSGLGKVRYFFYRLLHHVPREQYEIAKAHQRGLQKGWEFAQGYRQKESTSN